MRHGFKKVHFKKGRDASRALTRKLVLNFLKHGKIDTTLKRAKVLKANIDRLVYKAQKGTSADVNVLKSRIGDEKAVRYLIDIVAPTFSDRNTGFTTMKKFGPRQGDNAEVARLEWIKPIDESASKKPKASTTKKKSDSKETSSKKSKKASSTSAKSKSTSKKKSKSSSKKK